MWGVLALNTVGITVGTSRGVLAFSRVRMKPLLAKYFVRADNSAKEFLQADGSLLVQLEKALYGLPEAGKLWHELLRDNLRSAGYTHKPNGTTVWRRIERDREGAEERRLCPLYWYS